MTAISTMIVELVTSFLVGHATLRSSPWTSDRYVRGPIFSRLGAADGGRRFSPGARAAGLSVPCFAIMRLVCRFIATAWPSSVFGGQVVVRCRAGGTRTPNRRFWRPVLYQLSYCPPGAVGPDGQVSSGCRTARRRATARQPVNRGVTTTGATTGGPVCPAGIVLVTVTVAVWPAATTSRPIGIDCEPGLGHGSSGLASVAASTPPQPPAAAASTVAPLPVQA